MESGLVAVVLLFVEPRESEESRCLWGLNDPISTLFK